MGLTEPGMDLRWYACDLRTGVVLSELPLSADSVRRRIANVESTALSLPVHDAATPADWASILIGGKTMIVLTVDNQPAQAWVVIDRQFGEAVVPVNVSTLEECASRTNVPDLDPLDGALPDNDYTTVAAALVAPLVDRFGFVVEPVATGKPFDGDQTYVNSENRSILDALNTDFMAIDGGPEWRMYVRWVDDTHRGFVKVLEIKPRVGQDRPHAIFDLDADGRGSIESYTRLESFAAGKGATMVIGTSDGSGSFQTDPVVSSAVAAGWPVWEERVNFTGVDDDTELANRATAAGATRANGAVVWNVTGRGGDSPMPGRDFMEGDTVHIAVAPRPPEDPSGGTGAPRILGWELSLTSAQPTLLMWDDGEDSDG